jgi:hypothetical protein
MVAAGGLQSWIVRRVATHTIPVPKSELVMSPVARLLSLVAWDVRIPNSLVNLHQLPRQG